MKNTFTIPILAQFLPIVNTFFEYFLCENTRLNILNILYEFHKNCPNFENNFHFFVFLCFLSEILKKSFIYNLDTIGFADCRVRPSLQSLFYFDASFSAYRHGLYYHHRYGWAFVIQKRLPFAAGSLFKLCYIIVT